MAEVYIVMDTTRLDDIAKQAPKDIQERNRKFAEDMVDRVQASFGDSPSRPGDPPGIVTGAEKAGVHAVQVSPTEWAVQTSEPYDSFMEYGTRHIAPRPFMRPVYEDLRNEVDDRYKDVIK